MTNLPPLPPPPTDVDASGARNGRPVVAAVDLDQLVAQATSDFAASAEERYERFLSGRLEDERARRHARRIVDAEERPPAAIPEIVTLAHRLAHPLPPIPWRVDQWQPEGSRVVLAAQFKSGKTTLVGNLVRSLADGAAFLGRYDTAPTEGAIAVLDFEMSQRQFVGWLGDQQIVDTERVLPISLRGKAAAFDIIDPDCRNRWAELFRQHGVTYVVWDCLRPVVDALGLDEHNGVGPLLVAFDQLTDESSVRESNVVHHMGHTGERSRGDSRIRDWPDVEWRLVRQDDDPASPPLHLRVRPRRRRPRVPTRLRPTDQVAVPRWWQPQGRRHPHGAARPSRVPPRVPGRVRATDRGAG